MSSTYPLHILYISSTHPLNILSLSLSLSLYLSIFSILSIGLSPALLYTSIYKLLRSGNVLVYTLYRGNSVNYEPYSSELLFLLFSADVKMLKSNSDIVFQLSGEKLLHGAVFKHGLQYLLWRST